MKNVFHAQFWMMHDYHKQILTRKFIVEWKNFHSDFFFWYPSLILCRSMLANKHFSKSVRILKKNLENLSKQITGRRGKRASGEVKMWKIPENFSADIHIQFIAKNQTVNTKLSIREKIILGVTLWQFIQLLTGVDGNIKWEENLPKRKWINFSVDEDFE